MDSRLALRLVLVVGIALSKHVMAADQATISPRTIGWSDLVPNFSVADNPLSKYTKAQLLALNDIASVRDRRARGEKISPIDEEDERAAAHRLKQQGLDVDLLLGRRAEFGALKRTRAQTLNPDLDGAFVSLPGYLLPLEYEDKQVTEFLLVPWVGACVHTPPPPPNQIVFVRAKSPFVFQGMFTPVQITGRISASRTTKALYIVDGASDITIGYAMDAAEVIRYQGNN